MFGLKHRAMNPSFTVRIEPDALIVSFPAPARTLSWAVLNGGFCHADHVINHHVSGSDRLFCAQPERWLEQVAARRNLRGKVVAMATAVEMKNRVRVSLSGGDNEVTCFRNGRLRQRAFRRRSGGCQDGRASAVATPHHQYDTRRAARLTDEAMVEAIQIATEGRVRALYEAGVRSSYRGSPPRARVPIVSPWFLSAVNTHPIVASTLISVN